MEKKAQRLSKTELERSLLDMIAAGRRLIHCRKNDSLRVESYNVFRQDLRQYEMKIRRTAAKGRISNLQKIAEEVANLIGELCKSLIRYISSFLVESRNIGAEGEYRTDFKNVKGCGQLKARGIGKSPEYYAQLPFFN